MEHIRCRCKGLNGATGNYAFVVNPTTLTDVPLNGSVNGTLAGSGQAELFTHRRAAVQSLTVDLDDNTNSDSNELYLRFGSPPTRETYDYRYSNANCADQSILVQRPHRHLVCAGVQRRRARPDLSIFRPPGLSGR